MVSPHIDHGARWFEDRFASAPIMAILRGMGAEQSMAISQTAWEIGVDTVEIPLQSVADERALRAVAALASARGKIVGAGTITTVEQVHLAADAGAAFLVSPGISAEVIAAAHAVALPILPGVATPSEVQLALSLGVTWMKAFPATWLGSHWFGHIRGPFPEASFVATGGIDAGNAEEFLAAGARVVAVGRALEDPAQLGKLASIVQARGVAVATGAR